MEIHHTIAEKREKRARGPEGEQGEEGATNYTCINDGITCATVRALKRRQGGGGGGGVRKGRDAAARLHEAAPTVSR